MQRVIHTQAKAVDDERAEKERVAGLLQTKTAEYDAKAAECEAERAEKERERAEKLALQTALDAKEVELGANVATANRNLLARDRAQRMHFATIADELAGVSNGRNTNFTEIKDNIARHFTSLWEGMDAGNDTKARITKAVQDVIVKVSNLRDEARQVDLYRGISEGRLCRSCAQQIGGGERRRKRGEN